MNKKDKNIKIEDAVVGKFYRIDVDKDTFIWESQWVTSYDGLIVEYLGKPYSLDPYPYKFKIIMGNVTAKDRRPGKQPGDIIRFDSRDALTLKKL